jgi:hypothetical protein
VRLGPAAGQGSRRVIRRRISPHIAGSEVGPFTADRSPSRIGPYLRHPITAVNKRQNLGNRDRALFQVPHKRPDQVGLVFQVIDKPPCEIPDAIGSIVDRHSTTLERPDSAKGSDRNLSASIEGLARHRRPIMEGARQ